MGGEKVVMEITHIGATERWDFPYDCCETGQTRRILTYPKKVWLGLRSLHLRCFCRKMLSLTEELRPFGNLFSGLFRRVHFCRGPSVQFVAICFFPLKLQKPGETAQ